MDARAAGEGHGHHRQHGLRVREREAASLRESRPPGRRGGGNPHRPADGSRGAPSRAAGARGSDVPSPNATAERCWPRSSPWDSRRSPAGPSRGSSAGPGRPPALRGSRYRRLSCGPHWRTRRWRPGGPWWRRGWNIRRGISASSSVRRAGGARRRAGIPRWSWPSWRSTWPSGFPGDEDWRACVQAFAWAHLGHARRERGDRAGAAEAFARFRQLWRDGGARVPAARRGADRRPRKSGFRADRPTSLNPEAQGARPDAFSGVRIRFEAPKRVSSVPGAFFRFPDALGRIPGSRETIQTVFEGIRAPGWRSGPPGKKFRRPDGHPERRERNSGVWEEFFRVCPGKNRAGRPKPDVGPWNRSGNASDSL